MVTLIWYRVLLYCYYLYMRIQNNSLNYMYDNCVHCSLLRCMCFSLYSVLCVVLCSVLCAAYMFVFVSVHVYVFAGVYVSIVCILYLCIVCVCVGGVRLRFVELNPIPPYMVTYAGIG